VRAIDIPAVPPGHAAPITNVALRPDGQRIATSSYDGTVIIWDARAAGELRPLSRLRHRRLVNAAAWNPARPGLLATASADKTAAVWDVAGESPRMTSVLARHTDDVNSVAWLPDGRRLVCVSEDGGATLWDGLAGRFLCSLVSHAAHCMMAACSGEGLIATVGEDGMVAVADPDAGVLRTRAYAASVEGCAWSHSGGMLAIARDDGMVDLLDADLSLLRSVAVSSSAARAVAWSDDDSELYVGAYDGAVHFLTARGTVLGKLDDDRLWPRSVAAARGIVAVGSFWSTPCLFEQRSHTVRAAPRAPTHGPNAMTVRGGDELVVGCDSGVIMSIPVDMITGAAPRQGPPGPRHATAATHSPVLSLDAAGGTVAFGTYSGRLGRIGPSDEGARCGAQVGAPLPSLLCGPDRIIAGTYGGDIVAADRRSLTPIYRRRWHDGSVKTLARVSADAFVSGATDRQVAIGTLTQRQVLWEHGNLVNSVAVLAGTRAVAVASASRDHTVKVGWVTREPGGRWRAAGVRTLIGPDESVKCVGLLGDPQAPVVLAGSYDFGLYAWPVARDRQDADLCQGTLVTAFTQGLSCICRIGPHTAAAAGWDGRISVLELADGTVAEVGRASVPELAAAGAGRDALAPAAAGPAS
jgi:toxoflavin biosynthesis protein ToxC